MREKAKLDEERMKDLQKQSIKAGKKNNLGKALAVAAVAAVATGGLGMVFAPGIVGTVAMMAPVAVGALAPAVANAVRK